MQVLNSKISTVSLILSLMLLLSAESVTGQGKHSIQFISNPILYKLGNLENQYTITDSRFISASYFNQPSHEFGVAYSIEKRKLSFITGFSWLHQKHRVNYIVFHPDEQYEWEILDYYDIRLTENLLGIRIGGEYRINKTISVGLGLNLYIPLAIKSNMPLAGVHYTRSIYTYYSTPDSSYSELTSRLEHRIKRINGKGLIIPDLFITHELSKNFSLTVGCRYRFWSNQGDWLLKYEVNGFTKASDSNNDQLLFNSRIKNKGVYIYFGLKYTLKLKKRDPSKQKSD